MAIMGKSGCRTVDNLDIHGDSDRPLLYTCEVKMCACLMFFLFLLFLFKNKRMPFCHCEELKQEKYHTHSEADHMIHAVLNPSSLTTKKFQTLC